MKALLKAITSILNEDDMEMMDIEDWADIKVEVQAGNHSIAASIYRDMDTYSRELIGPYARKSKAVKDQAAEALNVNWLF